MILPKFSWNDGSAHNFTPAYPPEKKLPGHSIEALRHDNFTGDGIGQWVTDRLDKFRALSFTMVPASDYSTWETFMDYALEGNVFTYYPDSTDTGTHFDYTLEDQAWDPKVVTKSTDGNWVSFTLNMRLYVP